MTRGTDKTEDPSLKPLTVAEEAFAQAVIEWHGNQSRAYRALHPDSKASDLTIWKAASEHATRPHVARRIRELRELHAASAADVVKEIVDKARRIVQADPAALIQSRTGCCRHCWGRDHLFQYTKREYARAWLDYAKELGAADARGDEAPTPFEDGGDGFDMKRAPHPDCPECGGEGITREVVPDTRYLSPDAALLYGGVKRTKNGLEVVMQDQTAWAEKVLKTYGAYVERKEISGPNGGPINTAGTVIAATATPDEAARIYADMVKGA
jgi:hypothetical protein